MKLLSRIHALTEIAAMGVQTVVSVLQHRHGIAQDDKDQRIAALESEIEALKAKRRR